MPQSYEEAIEAFNDADTEYKMREAYLLGGEFLNDILKQPNPKETYLGMVEDLKASLENRNVALKTAQDQLRQKVVLETTKWRGPEGKPTILTSGRFKVSSVTRRSFDPQSLFKLATEQGLLERLMDLKTLDKDGKEKMLVKEGWDIDFEGVHTWLKANKLTTIIDGAYDEEESTPQVKGPKPLTFLGEAKG
jgi:hypothetical protein